MKPDGANRISPLFESPYPIPEWRETDSAPRLLGDSIHLWLLPRSEGLPPTLSQGHLSPRELARAKSISDVRARARYVEIRRMQRQVLGAYLGMSAAAVPLEADVGGKPFVDLPGNRLRFNLTHSESLCLLALRLDGEIGIDAERLRDRPNLPAIARRMFGSAAADALQRLDGDERVFRFHALWTRMEAGVKVRGGSVFDPAARRTDGLAFRHFIPLPGFLGCLGVHGACPDPARWTCLRLAGG